MRLRALLVASALLGCFGVVLARAAKVQLLDRGRLSRLARDQTRREIEWAPRRGLITDRRGAQLGAPPDRGPIFRAPAALTPPPEPSPAAHLRRPAPRP